MEKRNLPDEQLHDLYHQLCELRRQEDEVFTKIYAHIELEITHITAIDMMVEGGEK